LLNEFDNLMWNRGQSLGLKEALEDMNDVLKFLKEKLPKN